MFLPPRRLVRGSALLVLVFLALAPTEAIADVPEDLGAVGDTTDEVTQAVGDTTDEVTQTAGDTTDQVTQTAGDTTGTSSSGAVGDTTPNGTNHESAQSDYVPPGGWRRVDTQDQIRSGLDFPAEVLTGEVTDEVGEPTDPCEEQPQLVCLGLLYGLGEFAENGARVLGLIATTGIGVIGLIIIALGLATAGSALVAASSRLPAPPASRLSG